MSAPTARQAQIYEAAAKAGSLSGAARDLGITVGAISSGVIGYRKHTGAPYPFVPAPNTRIGAPNAKSLALIALPDRVAALEQEVVRLRAIVQDAQELIVASHRELAASVQDFLHRQPIVLAPPPNAVVTHRRIADGGVGGRREARAAS